MALDETWLQTNSDSLAAALDGQREAICATLTTRLLATFPRLCYDPKRVDGRAFQRMTMRQTPQRLHLLIQSALRLRNLGMIERQYRWGWPMVQRFGGHRQHLITHIYWYFEVARATLKLENSDRAALSALETEIVQMVERATMIGDGVVRSRSGKNHSNGHKSHS